MFLHLRDLQLVLQILLQMASAGEERRFRILVKAENDGDILPAAEAAAVAAAADAMAASGSSELIPKNCAGEEIVR